MSDEGSAPPPDGGNPLGGLLERARPDAGFAAHQSLQVLQSRLFGRTAQTTMIGRYTLGPRLGAGGGGTVYRALDTESGRTVAIKLLISDGRGGSARARLLREAQSLAKLRHPNIVEFHEVGTFDPVIVDPRMGSEGDNGVFLAMELVEGENLASWAELERPWKVVRDVFLAAGRGLSYAHARGFAHRDFKPSNVLVGSDGRTRVADFGLARVTRELTAPLPGVSVRLSGESSLPGLHISLTKPGAVVGTPAYMAPEQHLSSRADARSDQFSFCLALYESLYRHSPFVGATAGKILEAKLRGIVAPPPRDTKVPLRLHRAIVRGLAPDPAARHPSMDVLLDALADDGGPLHPARVVLAVTAAIAIVGLGGWLALRQLIADPCDAVPAGPAGWSPEVAASIQLASSTLALGYGGNTFERVRDDLDSYALRWSNARARSCEPDAREQLPPRLGCLDERARLLAAMGTALAQPTTSVLEHAIAATHGLPDPEACLAEPAPGWVDAAALADDDAAALRDELARVEVAVALRRSDAGALAEQLLARAQADQLAGLIPHARLLLGLTQVDRDPSAAAVSIEAAYQEAEALGLAALVQGCALAGLEHAVGRNDLAGARSWLGVLATTAGSADPRLRARVQVAAAELAALEPDGGDERAAAHCRDAAAIADQDAPVSVTTVAVARGCAMISLSTGRISDALIEAERAGAVAERVYGSDHPVAALARIELAAVLMAAGRDDAALAQARSGLDLLERGTAGDDPRRLLALLLLAELQRVRDPAESGQRRGQAEAIAQLDDDRRLAHAEATFVIAMAQHDRTRAHELADIAHGRARRLDDDRLAARITAWLAR